MRRLRQRFPTELVVIGVHSAKFTAEHITANIDQAIRRHGIDHPVVNDTGFDVWQGFAIRAWPTVVLIDAAGYMAAKHEGELDAETAAPVLEKLIGDAEGAGLLDRQPLDLGPMPAAKSDSILRFPSKLLAGGNGRLWVADSGQHRILELRLDNDGRRARVARIFGSGRPGLIDGSDQQAAFHHPHGLALSGNTLFVADTDNHAIRAIDCGTGQVRTIAGTGEIARGSLRPSSRPLETALRSPWDLAAVDNVLLIAMAGSHQIWSLVDGKLGWIAGGGFEALRDGEARQAGFNQPSGLAVVGEQLFVADPEASAIRQVTFGQQVEVQTLVGQGLFEFGDQDGPSDQARLQHPTGLAVGAGRLWVADSYNHKIKQIDPATGAVSSLIGSGRAGHTDGPFATAELYQPEGLAYEAPSGRWWIADTNNHCVRRADIDTGELTTLALES